MFEQENKTKDIRGLEISKEKVQNCLSKGLTVIEGNAESDLKQFPKSSFDYVILSQTLQAFLNPELVINELLKVGKKVIVTSKKRISKMPLKIKDMSLMHCPADDNGVDPEKFLKKISKLNFSSILLESGPKLLGAFGDRNLIDEYIFYISPERLKNKALHFYGGEKKINF